MAAYRLTHLTGAPPSPISPNSPILPVYLPLHLLPKLSPTEKRARRLAVALDADDPAQKDWAMEEYVKLGQAGRRLVREGVFEVDLRPEDSRSREEVEEEERERERNVSVTSASEAGSVRSRVRECVKCGKKIEDGRWIRAESGKGVLCDRCWKNMYLPKVSVFSLSTVPEYSSYYRRPLSPLFPAHFVSLDTQVPPV